MVDLLKHCLSGGGAGPATPFLYWRFLVMADRWADMAGGILVSLLPVGRAEQLKANSACLRIFRDLSATRKKYLTYYLI
ncbi:hypothetical protein EAY64_00550 [Aquitalea palustris]|uniref:Uncharacterized protein n=1 Tax=Aquitalea palustris TaxID=2480983 RepID=A0A454JNI5_9NEIS|nr:hypothetical protein [Aquitalea palustris]RMD01929.1 hypothetical protein EAY64_00550 [Aquitalea palustris]